MDWQVFHSLGSFGDVILHHQFYMDPRVEIKLWWPTAGYAVPHYTLCFIHCSDVLTNSGRKIWLWALLAPLTQCSCSFSISFIGLFWNKTRIKLYDHVWGLLIWSRKWWHSLSHSLYPAVVVQPRPPGSLLGFEANFHRGQTVVFQFMGSVTWWMGPQVFFPIDLH